MKKFLQLAIVLTLINCFVLTKAMEEKSPDLNALEPLSPEAVFPHELWLHMLDLVLDDLSVVDKSANIYEAIKNLEDHFFRISLVCSLFRGIKEECKGKCIEKYRAHLKQNFLEHKNQGTDLEGLYGKSDEFNINGCTGNIDYVLARYMLENKDSDIFASVVCCLRDDSAKKEKNVCILLSFFGADINFQNPMSLKNRDMALEWAIGGRPHLVPLLLAKGAIVHDEILELPQVKNNEKLLAILTEAQNKSRNESVIES